MAFKPVIADSADGQKLPTVDVDPQERTDVLPEVPAATVTKAASTTNAALAELNAIRARRGLFALVEDPSLTVIAQRKATIQANAGAMYHPGGSMCSARYEGVGMGPQFISCYQNATNVRYAGAASVVGRNGQRFHCLLLR